MASIQRKIRFNSAAVAAHLRRKNPTKYQKTVRGPGGARLTVPDRKKLNAHVQLIRKKVAIAKGKQLAKASKPIRATLVKPEKPIRATLVQSSSGGGSGGRLTGEHERDRSNLRRLGAVMATNRAYRQRVMSVPSALHKAGTYKFGK